MAWAKEWKEECDVTLTPAALSGCGEEAEDAVSRRSPDSAGRRDLTVVEAPELCFLPRAAGGGVAREAIVLWIDGVSSKPSSSPSTPI